MCSSQNQGMCYLVPLSLAAAAIHKAPRPLTCSRVGSFLDLCLLSSGKEAIREQAAASSTSQHTVSRSLLESPYTRSYPLRIMISRMFSITSSQLALAL